MFCPALHIIYIPSLNTQLRKLPMQHHSMWDKGQLNNPWMLKDTIAFADDA